MKAASSSMSSNDISESENGIKVYLRIRPSKQPSGYIHRDDINENLILFKIPKKSIAVEEETQSTPSYVVNNSRSQYSFAFHDVLNQDVTQEDVFRSVGVPAVRNVLNGFNSTVFAYGQTGSGKTFTITGGPERYADRGIIPRAISMLFEHFQSKQKSDGVVFTCFISYLELYNEHGYDLLNETTSHLMKESSGTTMDSIPKVTMLEDEKGNYHFRNLSVHRVQTEEEALNLLFIGDTNRAIGETAMNQSSSRSHCIFSIIVEARKNGLDTVVKSKLNLVDLAGSERVHKTNSTGQTLKEAQYINTSLFFLEMVIVALHERSKNDQIHIPYRNSMMTSVLRDSLGGNCKTLMIATISPEANQTDESISTCHFAQRVALVKNSAYINEELEPELVIERLKKEVKRLREEVRFLKGENGEGDNLNEDQFTALEEKIHDYVSNYDPSFELDVGSVTLTKIKASYTIFKKLLNEKTTISPKNDVNDQNANEINSSYAELHQKIASLEKTLKQRDYEINILVNMVRSGSSDNKEFSGINNTRIQDLIQNMKEQKMTNQTNTNSGHDNVVQNKKTPLTHFLGVERCISEQVLNDPLIAFKWFKERYPGTHVMEKNKKDLQIKFEEAKQTGEKVKKSRLTINQSKAVIEDLRRGIAIHDIFHSDQVTEHPTESHHRSIIEHEKHQYDKAFQKLKDLKADIELIKKKMEQNRIKMQQDFDSWYSEMCGKMESSPSITVQESSSVHKDSIDKEREPKRSHTSHEEEHLKLPPNAHQDIIYRVKEPERSDGYHEEENFKLPPGARLTGNKEADSDIIAFYKAKEAFQARMKRKEG